MVNQVSKTTPKVSRGMLSDRKFPWDSRSKLKSGFNFRRHSLIVSSAEAKIKPPRVTRRSLNSH